MSRARPAPRQGPSDVEGSVAHSTFSVEVELMPSLQPTPNTRENPATKGFPMAPHTLFSAIGRPPLVWWTTGLIAQIWRTVCSCEADRCLQSCVESARLIWFSDRNACRADTSGNLDAEGRRIQAHGRNAPDDELILAMKVGCGGGI